MDLEDDVEVDYGNDEGDAPGSSEKAMDVGAGEEIYGDLYDDEGEKDVLLKSKHAALQEQCRDQVATIEKLREKLDTLMTERDEYQEERRILIRNISCLFRTAQEELARKMEMMKDKDKTIRQLKDQKAKQFQAGGPTSPPQPNLQTWQPPPQ